MIIGTSRPLHWTIHRMHSIPMVKHFPLQHSACYASYVMTRISWLVRCSPLSQHVYCPLILAGVIQNYHDYLQIRNNIICFWNAMVELEGMHIISQQKLSLCILFNSLYSFNESFSFFWSKCYRMSSNCFHPHVSRVFESFAMCFFSFLSLILNHPIPPSSQREFSFRSVSLICQYWTIDLQCTLKGSVVIIHLCCSIGSAPSCPAGGTIMHRQESFRPRWRMKESPVDPRQLATQE